MINDLIIIIIIEMKLNERNDNQNKYIQIQNKNMLQECKSYAKRIKLLKQKQPERKKLSLQKV